jgi:HK97 family phage prohead protease
MPIKNDREYRNLGVFTRSEGEPEAENNYIVEGYASTFERYELFEQDGVKLYEQIEPTAFDDADMSDVVFLRDHEGRVYARTKNDTLQLSIDEHGLFTRTDLSKTAGSREMFEDIDVGNYSQMSFAFTVAEDGDDIAELEDGNFLRTIRSINKVYDVSAVSFPANPTTDIGVSARGLLNGAIEQKEAERLLAEARRRAVEKVKLKIKIAKEME